MGSKLLKSLMSVVLVIGLMPTLALADDTTSGNDATPQAGDVVQEGNVLVGATGSVDAGNRTPKYNDVTYKITLNDDLQTYTLTFDGNGEIPTYYTESQGTAADGTEGAATPAWKVSEADQSAYPQGYVTDNDGNKHALPSEKMTYIATAQPIRLITTRFRGRKTLVASTQKRLQTSCSSRGLPKLAAIRCSTSAQQRMCR